MIIILFLVNKLSTGLGVSYIAQVKELVGFPVAVICIKPTIEYGEKWGVFADNLYASLDCIDEAKDIEVALGLNCFNIAPFYRMKMNKFDVWGGIGLLRIDMAGVAHGKYAGYSYAGPIDEERMGIYGSIRAAYMPTSAFTLKPVCSTSKVKDGSFWELGVSLMFKPFRKTGEEEKKETLKKQLEYLFLFTGIYYMRLEAKLEEDISYPASLGNYLIGIGYEQ